MEVAGRAAVVTGAGSGIGRALALEAVARGMDVALLDADAAALAETHGQLRESGRTVLAERVDIRDDAAVQAFAATVRTRFPDIAAVFANAGVLRAGLIGQQPAAEWRLMVDVNVVGTLATVSAFVPILSAQASPSRIVITGSQSSLIARPDVCVYSATKHALWGLAEGLSFELARAGVPVGVTFVAPGGVATGIAGTADPAVNPVQFGIGRALATHGMAAEALAAQMLGAVAAERFWVISEAGTRDQLRARIDRVLADEPPQP